jgi:hypothetical protein
LGAHVGLCVRTLASTTAKNDHAALDCVSDILSGRGRSIDLEAYFWRKKLAWRVARSVTNLFGRRLFTRCITKLKTCSRPAKNFQVANRGGLGEGQRLSPNETKLPEPQRRRYDGFWLGRIRQGARKRETGADIRVWPAHPGHAQALDFRTLLGHRLWSCRHRRNPLELQRRGWRRRVCATWLSAAGDRDGDGWRDSRSDDHQHG